MANEVPSAAVHAQRAKQSNWTQRKQGKQKNKKNQKKKKKKKKKKTYFGRMVDEFPDPAIVGETRPPIPCKNITMFNMECGGPLMWHPEMQNVLQCGHCGQLIQVTGRPKPPPAV
eukprot:g56693.t1